jgi:hypothetical protein
MIPAVGAQFREASPSRESSLLTQVQDLNRRAMHFDCTWDRGQGRELDF